MRSLKKVEQQSARDNIQEPGLGGVGRSKKHESADKHVSGEAVYIDDRPELRGQLHAAVGQLSLIHI